MSNEEFFRLISKTTKKNRIIGVFLLLFGILTIVGAVTLGSDTSIGGLIVLYVLSALCLLSGVILIVKSAQSASQMKNGSHPLAGAILKGDQSFVVWFYQQVHTVNNVNATAAHQIWICDRTNKNTIISVRASAADDVMQYLSSKFPGALMGYSEQNKKEYNARVS